MKTIKIKDIAPQFLITYLIIWLSVICLFTVTIQASGNGDEMYLRFVSLFSFWMNTALAVLFAAVVIAFSVYNFGKGIQIQHTWGYAMAPALGNGLAVHPDILVFSLSPDESQEAIADRWEQARSQCSPQKWAVFIPFRQPFAVIHNLQEDIPFTRDTPPYQGDNWELKIVPASFRFASETWDQYMDYLNIFCRNYPEWASGQKVIFSDRPGTAAGNLLRAMVTTCFVALLFATGFSQKSAQVREYLGEARYASAPEKGTVKFVFAKAVIARMADGKQSYEKLLPAADYYTDESNAGKLVAIQANGETILPEPKAAVRAEVPKEESARNLPAFALRDSAQTQQWVDHSQQMVDKWKADIWKGIKPYWGLLTYIISALSMPIMLLGGWLWYICYTAANESALNRFGQSVVGRWIFGVHQSTAALLLAVAWVEATVILVNSFTWMVYKEFNGWGLAIAWGIELGIAAWLTGKLVPNARVIGGARASGVNDEFKRLN